MKVVVDFDECASNAVCMGIAPEVFEVRDDGFLYVLNERPGPELEEKVRQASRKQGDRMQNSAFGIQKWRQSGPSGKRRRTLKKIDKSGVRPFCNS